MKFKEDHGGRRNYFPSKLKKDLTGDCVIRAIAIATGNDYMDVMRSLFAYALEIGFLPNNERVYNRYLENRGFVLHKPFRKPNGRKYKLGDVPIDHTKAYIFHTTRHVTAVVNGVNRDSWNCQEWCANSYYVKSN